MVPLRPTPAPNRAAPARAGRARRSWLPLLAPAALTLAAGCAATAGDGPGGTSTHAASASAHVTLTNCGHEVTLPAPPQRVVLLDSAPVSTLDALGVLDAVVARGAHFQLEPFTPDLRARIDSVPVMTDRVDATGHVRVSLESVLALRPDLVLGATDTVDHTTSPVPLLKEPGYCGDIGEATFDDVTDQVDLYGRVFGVESRAAEVADGLDARVAGLRTRAEEVTATNPRTVAVLYPAGAVTYAYGRASMSFALTEAAGLSNVFADVPTRVVETSGETIAHRDPDVLIVLHSGTDADAAVAAALAVPGSGTTTAVRSGAVLAMPLNLAEPPTPLAVDGLAELVTWLEAHP